MNFDKLKYIREEKELTQQQMADILGVKRSAYSLWEINKNTIPLTKLVDFCNKFNVSLDYITGLSDKRRKLITPIEFNLEKVGKKIKIIRKDLNLTQEKLAKIFNTTHSGISAYENGKTIIPTIFLIEFAKISNVSLDWFVGISEKKIYKNKKVIKFLYLIAFYLFYIIFFCINSTLSFNNFETIEIYSCCLL